MPGKIDIADLKIGLSNQEASLHIHQFGLNELDQVKPESIWSIL